MYKTSSGPHVPTIDMKRSASPTERLLSPPPIKRKLESTTTNKAVASFFKPVSQKGPETLTWRLVHHSLIIGRYKPDAFQLSTRPGCPVRIAAFDLDDTLVRSKQGGRSFARNANTHVWWDPIVPIRLKQLHGDGYLIVIFSNQGSISLKDNAKSLQKDSQSLRNFKDQVAYFLTQLEFPVAIYAATAHDHFRKPRTGMWKEALEDFDLCAPDDVNMEDSFYIGDAAGREKTEKRPKDHATSDRDLAANIGIKFQTPEEFFLNLETEPYVHPFEPKQFLESATATPTPASVFTKHGKQELAIFCGSPGAGKSSFYWKVLQPQGYERVNQDILKTREKCIRTARQLLEAGASVAVDNTNRDKEARAHWVKVARDFGIPIRCVVFTASSRLCEHNDAVRAHNRSMNPESRSVLPPIAFRSFQQSFVQPSIEEGFQDITISNFEFEGTVDDRVIWSKYWVSKFST